MIRSKLLGFEVGIKLDKRESNYGMGTRAVCSYEIVTPTGVTFTGSDYSPAPYSGSDYYGLDSTLGLLFFICQNPMESGASDDFFAGYTPDQSAWAASFDCESASGDVSALEEAIGDDPDSFHEEMNYSADGQSMNFYWGDRDDLDTWIDLAEGIPAALYELIDG